MSVLALFMALSSPLVVLYLLYSSRMKLTVWSSRVGQVQKARKCLLSVNPTSLLNETVPCQIQTKS